jgi:hypothetical protein
MRKIIRKFVKIGGLTIGVVFALFSAYLALLIYPGVLFANSVEYNNLEVYSEDDLSAVGPILENIDRALTTSEINDPTINHKIFFGHNNAAFKGIQGVRNALLARVVGRGCEASCNISLPPYISHSMTFYLPVIETNSLAHPDGSSRVNQNLSRTLTHEVVHTLMMAELGLQRIARTPMWKQEGYGDYVAASTTILADPNYRIRASVERILDQDLSWLVDETGTFGRVGYGCQRFGVLTDEEGRRWNTCYYITRVMVEYSLDIKGMTFHELMNPGITDTETLAELFAAYENGTLQ